MAEKLIPNGFLVNAHIDNGKHKISVTPLWSNNPQDHKKWVSQYNEKRFKEWQVSYHESLKELRSAIMIAYGMGWFNRIRNKLNILSLRYPEKIHG